MRLVIDANILVAAFLKAATTRNLLLDERLELFSPEHLMVEGKKVIKERFSKKGVVSEFALDQLFTVLIERIRVLPKEEYASSLNKALEVASHEEDAPYLACSLHLEIPLWSNDAELKEQNLVRVISTRELLEEIKR